MTKSILEEIAESAQHVARCPGCELTPGLDDRPRNQMGPGNNGVHKRGPWEGLKRRSMPVCRFCQGQKVVFLNRICECGMPAIIFDLKAKVWTCGDTRCTDHAVFRLTPSSMVKAYPSDGWE